MPNEEIETNGGGIIGDLDSVSTWITSTWGTNTTASNNTFSTPEPINGPQHNVPEMLPLSEYAAVHSEVTSASELMGMYNNYVNSYRAIYGATNSYYSVRSPKLKDIVSDDDFYKNKDKDDMILKELPLTKEEIARATTADALSTVLGDLALDGSANGAVYPIGHIFTGTFELIDVQPRKGYLVLGHMYGNVVCGNNKESANKYYSTTGAARKAMSYILVELSTNKVLCKPKAVVEERVRSISDKDKLHFIKNLKYVIKDSDISGKVFGFHKVKKEYIGKTFSPIEFDRGISKKLGQETYYIIVHDKENKRNLKFCIADVQLVLPNLKGYNFPKDKTINRNSVVIIKGEPGTRYKVVALYPNPNSKKIERNSSTRQLDIIQIADGMRTRKVYAKNLKLITV